MPSLVTEWSAQLEAKKVFSYRRSVATFLLEFGGLHIKSEGLA